MSIFKESEAGELRPARTYSARELFLEGIRPTYTDGDPISSPAYEWQHSLGEIVTALTESGLAIQFLHEFHVSAYRVFPSMTRHKDGWWRFPQHNHVFPQMFSIKAVK